MDKQSQCTHGTRALTTVRARTGACVVEVGGDVVLQRHNLLQDHVLRRAARVLAQDGLQPQSAGTDCQ
jgi:hypothetical protein